MQFIVTLTSRVQKYINYATPALAAACKKLKFDIVQIKFDGWWARIVIKNGVAQIFSRQNQLKDTFPAEGVADMVLLGEYLKGTNRSTSDASAADVGGVVMVFDALHFGKDGFINLPYRDRHDALVKAKAGGLLPEWCRTVMSWDTNMADKLWEMDVVACGAEGLVFRRSEDNYLDATIGRVKQEFSVDYVIMGFTEGGGKRAKMAGNLIGGLYVPSLSFAEAAEIRAKFIAKNPNVKGWTVYGRSKLVPKVSIGGGFNDSEMKDQFDNFRKYAGRVLEVKGWQIFESGAMRHPNAVRESNGSIKWRDDKSIYECVWDS